MPPLHPAYFETQFAVADPAVEFPHEFVIMTAYATTGESWTDQENESADRELEAVLCKTSRLIGRITGFSPSTGHAEPGWAAGIPWQDACDLGLQFRQDAIYVVEGDRLFVTFCDDRRQLVPVGAFRERLQTPKS